MWSGPILRLGTRDLPGRLRHRAEHLVLDLRRGLLRRVEEDAVLDPAGVVVRPAPFRSLTLRVDGMVDEAVVQVHDLPLLHAALAQDPHRRLRGEPLPRDHLDVGGEHRRVPVRHVRREMLEAGDLPGERHSGIVQGFLQLTPETLPRRSHLPQPRRQRQQVAVAGDGHVASWLSRGRDAGAYGRGMQERVTSVPRWPQPRPDGTLRHQPRRTPPWVIQYSAILTNTQTTHQH